MHFKRRFFLVLMMVLIIFVIAALVMFMAFRFVRYNENEMLQYIKDHDKLYEYRITGLVYDSSGEDEKGGYINYTATLEDGSTRTLRVNVVFSKVLNIFKSTQQTGPSYRIRDFEFTDAPPGN